MTSEWSKEMHSKWRPLEIWPILILLFCSNDLVFQLFRLRWNLWRAVYKMNALPVAQPTASKAYLVTHTHTTQPFALWTLSGTTRVRWYQKVHFVIFWIFWSKMKITQADAPTIWMDCYPIQTNCNKNNKIYVHQWRLLLFFLHWNLTLQFINHVVDNDNVCTFVLAMYMPVVLSRCLTWAVLYTCRTSFPPNSTSLDNWQCSKKSTMNVTWPTGRPAIRQQDSPSNADWKSQHNDCNEKRCIFTSHISPLTIFYSSKSRLVLPFW